MYPLRGAKPYPKNAWYMAAWSSEVRDGMLARKILGVPVVLFRDQHGEVRALDDRCPHRRYPLSKGSLTDGVITCQYHGFAFDGKGRCVSVPTMNSPVAVQKARSFPMREVWNWVWIWMGDPELAEDFPLPDLGFVHADEPGWAFHEGGHASLSARYMLLHDNLLDLSHLTYLHKETVGSPGVAKAKLRVKLTNDGLELERSVIADILEGTPIGIAMGIAGPVDRIMKQLFVAPSIHITMPEIVSSVKGGSSPGQVFGAFSIIHAITPESPTASHYFWGFTRNFQQDPAFGEKLATPIFRAIREDIDAAETIESFLRDGAGMEGEIHSPADKAGLMGRRLIQSMIDAEEENDSGRCTGLGSSNSSSD